jgi:MFS family permease
MPAHLSRSEAMQRTMSEGRRWIETDIPQRLDRLPWSKWHWWIVLALGVTWILDGLEVTIVEAMGPVLTHPRTLALTEADVGLTASAYLAGTVGGALLFSYLADLQGRKRWFLITLAVYLSATVLTALSWNLVSFMVFRFLTGAGIGGEYSAINSAIDELIPARVRGHIDLAINGSWWVGTFAGALLTIPLLNPRVVPEALGWRLCFAFGSILGFGILLVRKNVPESPRWLITRGIAKEAERIVATIEEAVRRDRGLHSLPETKGSVRIHPVDRANYWTVARELLRTYPRRTVLGTALMVTQSFLYNAVFFTYALVLSKFYEVPSEHIGIYILPFAAVNFCGPLILGRFFDTIGRRLMIAMTYGVSGLLLATTGYLFWQGHLTATTQTVMWSAVFFFASAGASAGYLTVSEIFPLEIRAMAIASFFIVAQASGSFAPWIFGKLIQTSSTSIFFGDLLAAGLMMVGAMVAISFGVNAERRPLEEVAPPLSIRGR